MIRGIFIM